MPRRPRPQHDATDSSHWTTAHCLPWGQSNNYELQLVGLESLTRTIFLRVIQTAEVKLSGAEREDFLTLRIVAAALGICTGVQDVEACFHSAEELLHLGAIWVLDPSTVTRPQNRPVWKRLQWTGDHSLLSTKNQSQESVTQVQFPYMYYTLGSVFRIHSKPPRFRCDLLQPSTEFADYVVYQDDSMGFAVVNKPGGLPSHATVDNATENMLYQYQKYDTTRRRGTEREAHFSLPQRLDTETSGLLLIATKKSFSSFISKVLQSKSLDCVGGQASLQVPTNVQKRYRCLVYFPNDNQQACGVWSTLQSYKESAPIVRHYLDANSSAPKRFVDPSFLEKHSSDQSVTSGKDRPPKWVECQLRILELSERKTFAVSPNMKTVAEVTLELLTGRTHQIRGQMAALGCPIVGDPLYGLVPVQDCRWQSSKSRESPKMALQCCHLSFPLLSPSTSSARTNNQAIHSAKEPLSFSLETSWWMENVT